MKFKHALACMRPSRCMEASASSLLCLQCRDTLESAASTPSAGQRAALLSRTLRGLRPADSTANAGPAHTVACQRRRRRRSPQAGGPTALRAVLSQHHAYAHVIGNAAAPFPEVEVAAGRASLCPGAGQLLGCLRKESYTRNRKGMHGQSLLFVLLIGYEMSLCRVSLDMRCHCVAYLVLRCHRRHILSCGLVPSGMHVGMSKVKSSRIVKLSNVNT